MLYAYTMLYCMHICTAPQRPLLEGMAWGSFLSPDTLAEEDGVLKLMT